MPDFSDPVQLLNGAKHAVIRLAAEPQPALNLTDDDGEIRITLNAANGNMFLRAKKKPGTTGFASGDIVFVVDGDTGDLRLGGGVTNGDLLISPAGSDGSVGTATFRYSAGTKLLLLL
jgi:hypothetical protein